MLPRNVGGNASVCFAYEWLFNGAAVAGADQATFVVPEFERSGELICAVTASNEAGNATATSSAVPVLIVSCCDRPIVLPANTSPPEIKGSPVPGGSLACLPGAWSIPSPTFTYRWLSNGVVIPGATSGTYTVPPVSGATVISCEVTAIGAYGSATASSPGVEIAFVVLGPPYGVFTLCGRGVELFQSSTLYDELSTIASCSQWSLLRLYRGGYGFYFLAPEPGTFSVDWYLVGRTDALDRHRSGHKLFAMTHIKCDVYGQLVQITLTALGRRALNRDQAVRTVVVASFVSSGGERVRVVRRGVIRTAAMKLRIRCRDHRSSPTPHA